MVKLNLQQHLKLRVWTKKFYIPEALVVATKEIGLEVNADKTKYMIMSRDQNAGQSHSMKTDNSSVKRVEEFKYLGTMLTFKNSIQEELKLGNACYYSVQNLLSSSLLSKNLKIKIYRTIILPIVLYGCETWLLTLREERRLRVNHFYWPTNILNCMKLKG